MSDRDWYSSQGVKFDTNPNQNQPILSTERTMVDSQTGNSSTKQQVTASGKNNFGQRTLAGLTIIILTLSLQLFVLLISALSSSDSSATTIEDFETAMKVQLWFTIFTITAQLVGIKLIYNDARDLSDFLDNDVEVHNNNLNVMAGLLNRK